MNQLEEWKRDYASAQAELTRAKKAGAKDQEASILTRLRDIKKRIESLENP